MYKTITKDEFCHAFVIAGRGDQFSRGALEALFDHLEELEEIELDIVAICCEYMEYTSYNDIRNDYKDMPKGDDGKTWLEGRTFILDHDEGVLIRNF